VIYGLDVVVGNRTKASDDARATVAVSFIVFCYSWHMSRQGREVRYNGIEYERAHDGEYRARLLETKVKSHLQCTEME